MRTFGTALLILLAGCEAADAPFDIVIRSGSVIDGSGSAPVPADVGVLGGEIVRVGDLDGVTAGLVIDATGLVVAPASSTFATGGC